MEALVTESGRPRRRQSGMSYKFQRLREKIRKAVESGELTGKLPGERALARRFHVNAKTLSKALTDLAAEGVLDRSIGRGTYVKGSAAAPSPTAGRWLIVCDEADETCSCTIEYLRRACPELQTATSFEQMRPSFLNQFTAVIDLARGTPESFLRDLIVRNMPVIAVNHEPRAYSVHAVVADVPLGVSRLARDLLLAGHRRLAAVEPRGGTAVAHALRQTAARYAPDATVDVAEAAEAAALVEAGTTALVCGSGADARRARAVLDARGIAVPGRVSLTAVGCACPTAACSGYFADCSRIGEAVLDLLRNPQSRPVTLWIPGAWIDRGTLAPTGAGHPLEHVAEMRVSGVVV